MGTRAASSPLRMRRPCSFVLLMSFAVVVTLGSDTLNEIVPEDSISTNGFPAEELAAEEAVSPVKETSNVASESRIQDFIEVGTVMRKKAMNINYKVKK